MEQHEEFLAQCLVVLREDVGEVEVGVDDARPLGGFPVDVDGGLDRVEPFEVDVGEVVLVDADVLRPELAADEVLADEMRQLLGILLIVVHLQPMVQRVGEEGFELSELLGAMVGGGDVPVEVVLPQYVEDGVVGQEGNLRRVEGTEECGRQHPVLRPFLTEGEDELDERLVDVVACAFLRLRPEQRLRLVQPQWVGGQ